MFDHLIPHPDDISDPVNQAKYLRWYEDLYGKQDLSPVPPETVEPAGSGFSMGALRKEILQRVA